MKVLIQTTIFILMVFNPGITQNENTWEIVGKMPHPVYGGQAAVVDSLIYIFGGYSDSLDAPVDLIQIYDPVSNRWKTSKKMPEPRYGFTLNHLGGDSLLTTGGLWKGSAEARSAEVLDLAGPAISPTDLFSRDTKLNRIYGTGHIYDHKYYLIGGISRSALSESFAFPFVLIYDLNDGKFSNDPDSIDQNEYIKYHHTSALLDTVIYIFGGVQSGISGKIYAINLNTNRIRPVDRLMGVRAGASSIVYDKSIYIIGGYSESPNPLNDVEIYYPNEKTTRPAPGLNIGRKEPVAVLFNQSIYVFGGVDRRDEVVPEIEKLDLLTGIHTATERLPDNFDLLRNYPNPFNAGTVIEFVVKVPGMIRLEIFSITGKYVRSLTNKRYPSGSQRFFWDGTDQTGAAIASGVYICRLIQVDRSYQIKMILLR